MGSPPCEANIGRVRRTHDAAKLSCSPLSMQVIGWTLGAIVIGALLYPLLMMARERKWCRFVGISPHEYKVTHCRSLACLDLLPSKMPSYL
jgi:hypothetical protein